MAYIKLNYPNTIEKAKSLKRLAEDVEKISHKLGNLEEESNTYWRGEAANAYRNECEELEAEIRNLKRKMDSLADAIIQVANAIKAADDAAQAAARNLGGS